MAKNQRLNATIQIGGAIAPTLKNAFGAVNKGISGVGKSVQDLERRQKLLGRSIREFGRAGKDVDGLRNSYAKLTQELDRARRAQNRLATARKRAETIVGVGGSLLRGVGVGAAAAGLAARPLIGAAIERENAVNVIRNSGVSKEDGDAMVKAAQDSKQFGVSVTKATETVSELRTALGDAHHAIEALPTTLKAISGLQLYNRGHKNQIAEDAAYSLAKIAEERGGASSPEALREKQNWAFKMLTGSNGVVTADDQLTAIRRGKSAVAAMDDRAFFGDTFLMQAMGANQYGTASSTLVNAWIGGHQTHGAFDEMMKLGLLNRGGVQFDKTGKVKKVSSSALIDNALFLKDPQAWVDKHLIPIAKGRGVDVSDPAQIAKFVNSIASNTNAANILMQRIRFSHNIAKDRHNVDIAHGIDESEAANRASTQGKIDNARARLNDAQVRMGNVLLPAFATAMERAASALESVNKFAEQSPTAFKAVTVGLVGLTGAVAGLATVGVAKTAVTGLVGALGSGAGGLASAVGALANPIGIAVLALGTLAAGIYAFRKISQAEVDAAKDHGGAKLTPTAQARVNAGALNQLPPATVEAPAQQRPLPAVPSMRGTTQNVINDSRSYSINVTAAPGMDHHQIADTVMRKIDQRDGVRRRSSMFDGASQ
ncbi:hypothetical protein L0Y97_20500 [Burkholderia multivorans]|uniref:hypothetical protein n=1 Tax=Burkholderia multivorans TaxID=87883 RepID=UPI002019CA28|nr:hypothetical protein [Burkholderia multivorans]MCO1361309.1 hypothetical protein [Burkholderia multivorans]MCO1421079.1 hypothetical protein [Burkholderia multivorans]UQO93629.1 hypothetical protein L0Z41_10455 [Burkholderia multivorans]